ncbi:MAG: hypothetical protein J6X95_09120 [Treponema sp.]|nr:hypothetical protein [Treponema sp.]
MKKAEVSLELLGSGSVNGSNGDVYKNVGGIDSAKTIVRAATVTFN